MLIVEGSWIRSGIQILVVDEPAVGVVYQAGRLLAGLCALRIVGNDPSILTWRQVDVSRVVRYGHVFPLSF
jgi:hypothetical protein